MKVINSIAQAVNLPTDNIGQNVQGRHIWGNRNIQRFHVEILPNDRAVAEIVAGAIQGLGWERMSTKRTATKEAMSKQIATCLNNQALNLFGGSARHVLWDGKNFTEKFFQLSKKYAA